MVNEKVCDWLCVECFMEYDRPCTSGRSELRDNSSYTMDVGLLV